jgi:hypothetical protein
MDDFDCNAITKLGEEMPEGNGKRVLADFASHILAVLIFGIVTGFITGIIWKTHMDDWVASIEKHVEFNDKRLDKAESQRDWLDERLDALELKEGIRRRKFVSKYRNN